MSLCGAWSLTGEPLETLLPENERRAMREHAAAAGGVLAENAGARLWILAARGDLAAAEGRVLALDGSAVFPAAGADARELLAREAEPGAAALPGHYALAYADLGCGRLRLARDPGGIGRLYYAVSGGLLLFSSSVRALLAGGRLPRRADAETMLQYLLCAGLRPFGPRTLFAGISELLPGRMLETRGGEISPQALCAAPEAPRGAALAPAWRRAFRESTLEALGSGGEAAVSLSGGLDSSALARWAAEALGPGRVTGITYDFDEPGAFSESEQAARFAAHLGIRHKTIRLTYAENRQAMPESLWRLEDGLSWGSARWIAIQRRLEGLCAPRILHGGEVFSTVTDNVRHKAWLQALEARPAAARAALRWARWTGPELWHLPHSRSAARLVEPRRWIKLAALALFDARPGLRTAYEESYPLLVSLLCLAGGAGDPALAYPARMAELARAVLASSAARTAVERAGPGGLVERAYNLIFRDATTYRLPYQMLRWEGLRPLVCPALFARCLALGRALWEDPPAPWLREKALVLEALREDLPQWVLARPKLARIAMIPPRWVASLTEELWGREAAVREVVAGMIPDAILAAPELKPVWVQLALWHRLWIESPPRLSPPAWEDIA